MHSYASKMIFEAQTSALMESGNTLIFFTDTFPCGKGETFIENEFPFLARAFSRIIIVTNNLTEPVTRTVSQNTQVVRYNYQPQTPNKVKALLAWFSAPLMHEREFLQQGLHLTLTRQRLTIMLSAYAKMLETEAFLNQLAEQEHLDKSKLYLYAYWFNNMAASIAFYRSKYPQVKAFCRAHRWDIYAAEQPGAYLPFRLFTLQHLNACFPISDDGLAYLSRQTQHRADHHLRLARLGTTPPPLPLPSGNTDKVNLVSCSYIIPRKRLHMLINALAAINDIPLEWTHYGAGPAMEEIQALATQKLAHKSNVVFRFAGQISNSELLQQYHRGNYDLFVNVSESEGIPVSIMEAISFGIPAIATDTGGSREVVVENESGYLLPVQTNALQIAGAIRKFWLLTPADKNKLRNKAHLFWDHRFNARNNYPAFLSLLNGL